MPQYRIQILDSSSYIVKYFDRMKTSYGGHRIITTVVGGKKYSSRELAEKDARIIRHYYPESCLVEVVECAQIDLNEELPF